MICQNLNVRDVTTLSMVSTQIRSDIVNDNVFWKRQFEEQFPHLIEKVIRNGEPKNWYAEFSKYYMDQYGFNDPDIEKRNKAYEKAALFIAAKMGDVAKLKAAYHTLVLKEGPSVDKSRHSWVYWLH